MRIGYMYDLRAYPPKGGNHVHALELTQGFVDAGHEVSVLDDPTMPRVRNFQSNQVGGVEAFISSIDVLYVRTDARYLSLWPALTRSMALTEERPVVWEINAPANETLAFSWLGGRSLDRPESLIKRSRRWVHAVRKLPSVYWEERHRHQLAQGVDAAICVSSTLSRYASEGLGIERALTLPNGGPLISEHAIELRRSKRTDSRFTVLYSGSAMYPWQGLDFLAQAIRLAERRAPDIRFLLAVNQRTDSLPTSSNVEVVEHLDREGIFDAICAADACVALHPEYTWSKYRFHGSPMKLFEYMACMSPVVTSRLGQMEELFHHEQDVMLCENSGADILDKLIWLRDHPKEALEIGRRGWERVQKDFSWKKNVDVTLVLFEDLLRRKR